MELPAILKQEFNANGQGLIELCPDEYDMGKIGEMLDDVLAECEQLVLGSAGQSASRVSTQNR